MTDNVLFIMQKTTTKMKASELRIGNWYNWDEMDMQWSFDDWRNMEFETSYIGGPIPLTEEWLLKFGFNRNENSTNEQRYEYLRLDCLGYNITFTNMVFEWQIINNANPIGEQPIIKHVHQLQNLYFALTGEELIIKND